MDSPKTYFPRIPRVPVKKGWGAHFCRRSLLSSILKLQAQKKATTTTTTGANSSALDFIDFFESINDSIHSCQSDIGVYSHMGPGGTRGKRNKMQGGS